jgi:hypothetical protein
MGNRAKLMILFTSPKIVRRFVFHCHVVKNEGKEMMTVDVCSSGAAGAHWIAVPEVTGNSEEGAINTPSVTSQNLTNAQ